MNPIQNQKVYKTDEFVLPENKKISKWRWYSLPGFFLKIAHLWNGSAKIEALDKNDKKHAYYITQKNFKILVDKTKKEENASIIKPVQTSIPRCPSFQLFEANGMYEECVQELIDILIEKGTSDVCKFCDFKRTIKEKLKSLAHENPITINKTDAMSFIPEGVKNISLLLPAALFEAIQKNDYAVIGTDTGYIVCSSKNSAEDELKRNSNLDPNRLYHKGNLLEKGLQLAAVNNVAVNNIVA